MNVVDREAATVGDLLDAAVARWPAAVAVVGGAASLTYAEVGAAADRLAHRLQAAGAGPDARVAVCLDRSPDLAVALWAVQKAGAACLPLDPGYPADRMAFMLRDAGAVAVVSGAGLATRLPPGAPPVVRVDGEGPPPAPAPVRRSTGPENLGYVIYTSGSTGQPKGVMLTHRGLVSHHRATVDLYGLGPGDRVLQFCSLGFDASIEEMFPTWAAGATVVFRPEDRPLLGRGWLEWVDEQGVTVVNLPTGYWHAWAHELDRAGWTVPAGIRLTVVGGERALGAACRAWDRAGGARSRWVNAYGPTETTCMSTYYERPPGAGGAEGADPPIGRPLPATTVAVVDDDLHELGAGVTGELLIGGAGLARGYLDDPELTAARFVEWPPGTPGAARMYRTGDLVRRRAGGDLEFVGRADAQVKVQGFRVECGEVEAALVAHPAVGQAAVVARDVPPGGTRLVAYVVGAGAVAPAEADLRRFLAGRLPAHMVPATFVDVDRLPLTPHGKVDRAALPAPAVAPVPPAGARSPAEDRVAAIWGRVLHLDAAGLGPDDDFFALGGHSLLATQVVAQVRDEFGTETPLRTIFESPSLGGLAAAIEAEAPGGAPPPLVAVPRRAGDRFPLSLAQEQMWDLEAAAVPPGLYNITALHRFEAPVDLAALRRALDLVVGRHEILRTGFALDAGTGRPVQFVVPGAAVGLRTEPGDDLDRRLAAQDAAPFDPGQPPLARAGLYGGAGGGCLAVTLDHLICDGTGAAVFMSELVAAYETPEPALPPLAVQFADFAVWQRATVTEAVQQRQLDWWRRFLDGMPLGPAVPFDHVPTAPARRMASVPVALAAGTRARLDEVARSTGATLFSVAVAGAGALLGHTGGTDDVVMSTTLSGRTRTEVEDLVGTFSGIGRLRVDLSGDAPFRTIVERARERVLGMFEHQDIPFLRVRDAVLPGFPASGVDLAAALPTEFQYFHVSQDQELFFRGQLHPLSITLLDDGVELTGACSYKLDFYEPATIERLAGDLGRLLDAVGADPSLRLSELPVTAAAPGPARRA